MSHYLIRARLKRAAPIATLAPLLLPAEISPRAAAGHRLVWSLFADDAAKKRDFLWREDDSGRFLVLAPEPPRPSEIFDLECKPFAPALAPGERLRFMLRANATVARNTAGKRGVRTDVVMAAIHHLPKGERAAPRREAIETAGRDWLRRQAATHGFTLSEDIAVDGYNLLKLPRPGGKLIELSTLDFTGILEVANPETFLAALCRGFGRARAFGCGLMLIRRA